MLASCPSDAVTLFLDFLKTGHRKKRVCSAGRQTGACFRSLRGAGDVGELGEGAVGVVATGVAVVVVVVVVAVGGVSDVVAGGVGGAVAAGEPMLRVAPVRVL